MIYSNWHSLPAVPYLPPRNVYICAIVFVCFFAYFFVFDFFFIFSNPLHLHLIISLCVSDHAGV